MTVTTLPLKSAQQLRAMRRRREQEERREALHNGGHTPTGGNGSSSHRGGGEAAGAASTTKRLGSPTPSTSPSAQGGYSLLFTAAETGVLARAAREGIAKAAQRTARRAANEQRQSEQLTKRRLAASETEAGGLGAAWARPAEGLLRWEVPLALEQRRRRPWAAAPLQQWEGVHPPDTSVLRSPRLMAYAPPAGSARNRPLPRTAPATSSGAGLGPLAAHAPSFGPVGSGPPHMLTTPHEPELNLASAAEPRSSTAAAGSRPREMAAGSPRIGIGSPRLGTPRKLQPLGHEQAAPITSGGGGGGQPWPPLTVDVPRAATAPRPIRHGAEPQNLAIGAADTTLHGASRPITRPSRRQ